MDPDLEQISIPKNSAVADIPVNHEDAVTVSGRSNIKAQAILNVHMESLPHDNRVPAREHMPVIGYVAYPCSLVRRRGVMEHG